MKGQNTSFRAAVGPVLGGTKRGRLSSLCCLKAVLLIGIALVLSACAKTHSEAFLLSRAEAERHYSHGRYQQSASAWKRASLRTEDSNERAEALYRAAQAERRAGNPDAARRTLTKLLARAPNGWRAPRAAYDLGLLEIERGNVEAGEARLWRLLVDYPESALATRAFERVLKRVKARQGIRGAETLVRKIIPDVKQPELLETLRFTRAKLLSELGEESAALTEYLNVAREFPYPAGAYWDDALWYAAEIERTRGAPRQALLLLERMLGESEPAHFQGSYTRPRYSQAQFRIAEIYRDDLHMLEAAQIHFRKVFEQYPTSLLIDDALWQEALVAHRLGDRRGTCNALETLSSNIPESRFVPCAKLLCPSHPAVDDRSCRRYIRKTLESEPSKASEPERSSSTR